MLFFKKVWYKKNAVKVNQGMPTIWGKYFGDNWFSYKIERY